MQLLAVATIACTDICLKKRQNKRKEKTPGNVDTVLVERTGSTSCSSIFF